MQLPARARHNPANRSFTERDVDAVLARYGVVHRCLDAAPFQAALTHPSYRGDPALPAPPGCMPLQADDYERLEHLGDAAVSLVVTEYLHARYPREQEAFLSQLRSKVVCGASLAALSRAAGLDRWVLLSAGAEAARARERPCIAEDVLEAFVAALFTTAGYPAARAWLVAVVEEHLDFAALIFSLRCSKDRLVRHCVNRLGFRPALETRADAGGASHRCVVRGGSGETLAAAAAATAREAELEACHLAMEAVLRRAA